MKSAYTDNMNKYSKDFYKRLNALLKEKGITQKELANAIGAHDSSVSYWLKNKKLPSAYAMICISKFFGVSMSYLILGITDETVNPAYVELVNKLDKLSSHDKDTVSRIIDLMCRGKND